MIFYSAGDDEVVLEIMRAWIVEGANPEYHNLMKQRLHKEWPVLAKALDRLVPQQTGKLK